MQRNHVAKNQRTDLFQKDESMHVAVTSYDFQHTNSAFGCVRPGEEDLSLEQRVYRIREKVSRGEIETCSLKPFQVKRRKRTSGGQFAILDRSFLENPKPSAKDRHLLAQTLNMTSRAVQVWFQNRRAKMKREQLGQAGSMDKKESSGKASRSKTPVMAACACPSAAASPLRQLRPAGETNEDGPRIEATTEHIMPNDMLPLGRTFEPAKGEETGFPISPPVVLSGPTPQYLAVQPDPNGFVPFDPVFQHDSYGCPIEQQPLPLYVPAAGDFTPPYFPLSRDLPDNFSSSDVEPTPAFQLDTQVDMLPTVTPHNDDVLHSGYFFDFPDALGIYTRGFGNEPHEYSGPGTLLLPLLG